MTTVAHIQIDFNEGREWYARLSDNEGVKLPFGRSAHYLGVLLKALKAEFPHVRPTYTPRAWTQNVTEFERDRHWRR